MNSVQALTGREYIKAEWRPVSTDKEAEALAHELLEVRKVGSTKIESTKVVFDKLPEVTEADATEEKISTRHTRRKSKDNEE